MPSFITLGSWTQKGIENVREGPRRLEAAREAASSVGGELKSFYLVFGRYDFVAISDFPDDEAAAKFALRVGSLGNVRTETLRAFDEQQYRSIISALG